MAYTSLICVHTLTRSLLTFIRSLLTLYYLLEFLGSFPQRNLLLEVLLLLFQVLLTYSLLPVLLRLCLALYCFL